MILRANGSIYDFLGTLGVSFLQNISQLCRPEMETQNKSKQPEQLPLNPDSTLAPAVIEYKASSGVEVETNMWQSSN